LSDHTVVCTINNATTETMTLRSSDANSGTSLTIESGGSSIGPGSGPVQAWKASGNATSGCGGKVIYTLPNGDLLVLAYNTSVHHDNAYCFVMLQGASGGGSDEYYCDVSGTVKYSTDSLTPSITVNVVPG
jgi:hypothetical protein